MKGVKEMSNCVQKEIGFAVVKDHHMVSRNAKKINLLKEPHFCREATKNCRRVRGVTEQLQGLFALCNLALSVTSAEQWSTISNIWRFMWFAIY